MIGMPVFVIRNADVSCIMISRKRPVEVHETIYGLPPETPSMHVSFYAYAGRTLSLIYLSVP